MVADEDPFEAARRGTLEEIGSAIPGLDDKLEVVKGEFEIVDEKPLTRAPTQWEETIESPSYPGLSTVYTLYQVEAFVEGVPLMGFTTEEMGKDKMLKVTHVWVWQPTIETSGVLSLHQVQEALLQRLYRGSQRVTVELLHAYGSNLGSLVLKVHSWDMSGRFNEPTIVKLDHAETLKREVQQNVAMLEHIQTNAAAIVRPAEYTNQWGGFVLEVAEGKRAEGAAVFAVRTEMEAKLRHAKTEAAEATAAREVAVQKVAEIEATMEIVKAEAVLAARRATEAAAADTAKKAEELESLLLSLSAFQAQVMQHQARQHSADAAHAKRVSVLEPHLHFHPHPRPHSPRSRL